MILNKDMKMCRGFCLFTALMILTWYPAEGQEDMCSENQTYYMRRVMTTVDYTTLESTRVWTEYTPDCSIAKKLFFAAWSIIGTDHCQPQIIDEYKLVERRKTKLSTTTVKECCLGYTLDMNSDNCTKADCEAGKYGTNCTEDCLCGIDTLYCNSTGHCDCSEGLGGISCTEACDINHYGRNCKYECECANNSTCNNTDGTCNCTSPGWEGELCNQECNSTMFGLDCSENCTCNKNQTCDRINGTCTCKPGWKGEHCTEECEAGKFGVGCAETCTCNNETTRSCNRTNGHCLCKPGYRGINCNHTCELGTYGQDCSKQCPIRCGENPICDVTNGSCWCFGSKGDNCSEECEYNKYGMNCAETCDCSMNTSTGKCNSTTGYCICIDGSSGPNCTEAVTSQSVHRGLHLNDIKIIVIASGMAVVVLIIGGAIIYRKRSSPSDNNNCAEDARKPIENKIYNVNLDIEMDRTKEPADNIMAENEVNGCHPQDKAASDKGDNEDNRTSSNEADDDNDSVISEPVVYEDADLELEKLESSDRLAVDDDEDDYDITDVTQTNKKRHTNFEEDENVYESADEDDVKANKEKQQPNHYNTFEEIQKIRKHSTDRDSDIENEEDYNVLEYFPTQHKKKSLKGLEDYSTLDSVNVVHKHSDDLDEENDYDLLNQTPEKKNDAVITHNQYNHVDLINKSIDGVEKEVFSSLGSQGSILDNQLNDDTEANESPEDIKPNIVKQSKVSSDTGDHDASFCDVDDADADNKSDIVDSTLETQEDIYEECLPDEGQSEENHLETPSNISSKTIDVVRDESVNPTEIVYESCGENSDEDETMIKTETEIVYESMSDTESEKSDTKDNATRNKTISTPRRRRSEDYEEFEL